MKAMGEAACQATHGAVRAGVLAAPDPAASIAAAATTATADALACRTIDLFLEALGGEAANLALRYLPRGGVVLGGGGIVPKLLGAIIDGRVLSSYLDRAGVTDLYRSVPLLALDVSGDELGQLGAWQHAWQLHCGMEPPSHPPSQPLSLPPTHPPTPTRPAFLGTMPSAPSGMPSMPSSAIPSGAVLLQLPGQQPLPVQQPPALLPPSLQAPSAAAGSAAAGSGGGPLFVPASFDVPLSHTSGFFELRPLRAAHLHSDFEAVMGSAARLRSVFAKLDDWPMPTLSREEDLQDLRRHEAEFERRFAFAYTVIAAADAARPAPRTYGCVYINPPTKRGFDAEVMLWAVSHGVSAATAAALDAELEALMRRWIADKWPFASVAFPGRAGLPWEAYEALPWRDEAVQRIGADAQTLIVHHARASGLAR